MSNKEKQIIDFFKSQVDVLDTEEMPEEHEFRVLKKIESKQKSKKKSSWFKYGTIVASILMLLSLFIFNKEEVSEIENNYPAELVEAKFYFEGLIDKELSKIHSHKNEANKVLIEDTLIEIQKLKAEEKVLLDQLSIQYNRRIIDALIDNFQIKIDLLKRVSQQIEEINQLNNEYHENIL